MTDVKRLLEAATPLPWKIVSKDGLYHDVNDVQNAALILHAVNHLPDYVAAVDALADLIELSQMFRSADITGVTPDEVHRAELRGRAAIDSLRRAA